MKKYELFLCLILVIISILSCENNNDAVPRTIQPLGVGFYWIYVDSSFSRTGEFTSSDTSKLLITEKVATKFENNDLELYGWKWCFSNLELDAIWLCNVDKHGFNFFGGRQEKSNYLLGRFLSRKYPVSEDESWEEPLFSYSTNNIPKFFIYDTIIRSCISTNTSYSTPLGNLECFVYYRKSDNGLTETFIYNAVNIGYVGFLLKENGITVRKKTLVEYRLKETTLKSVSNFISNNSKQNNSVVDAYGVVANEY